MLLSGLLGGEQQGQLGRPTLRERPSLDLGKAAPRAMSSQIPLRDLSGHHKDWTEQKPILASAVPPQYGGHRRGGGPGLSSQATTAPVIWECTCGPLPCGPGLSPRGSTARRPSG